MLQVFHLVVAKVDLDVAYTCKLQVYVLSISVVSYVCCKCFIQMFTYVLQWLHTCFEVLPAVLQVF
jgi:hypothetical protein